MSCSEEGLNRDFDNKRLPCRHLLDLLDLLEVQKKSNLPNRYLEWAKEPEGHWGLGGPELEHLSLAKVLLVFPCSATCRPTGTPG